MSTIQLTPAQRKDYRAAAHHLDPVVHIGNDGLTAAVQREIDNALKSHGLIKVRVFSDDRVARAAMLLDLAERLSAAPIQHIGKLLVLWRPMPEKEKAEVTDRKPGPKTVKVVSFSKSGNHRATVKKVTVLGNERLSVGGIIKRARVKSNSLKKKSTA